MHEQVTLTKLGVHAPKNAECSGTQDKDQQEENLFQNFIFNGIVKKRGINQCNVIG